MLLSGLSDPRSFLGADALSYSEFATLANCEKKWSLIYDAERRESDSSAAMELGTEMHRLLNIWWGPGAPLGWKDTEDETAAWLMERYHQHYMDETAPLHMIDTNIPFAVRYAGRWLFGWFDGLVRNYETGELWIVEFKTMGNWSRLHQLPKDHQISFYLWVAGIMGLNVAGVMFDAILTTHWKTEEGEVYKSGPKKGQPKDFHPPADSFDRRWVQRTAEQMSEFEQELKSVLDRRDQIRFRPGACIANVGSGCSWCSVMPQCYGIEIDLLDDDPFA